MDTNQQPLSSGGSTTASQRQSSRIYLIACIAALGGLLFGYDTGVISGAILYLTQDFHLTSAQTEFVVSVSLIGGVIGALAAGPMNDALGRKKTMGLLASIFLLGALYSSLAPDYLNLVFARIIVGLGFGAIASVVPVYISEVAPTHLRGRLVTLNQVALTIGIAVSYGVDLLFARFGMGWRPMFAAAAVPSLLLLLGLLIIPETPRWLASHGHWEEAQTTLHQLGRSPEEASQELDEIKQSSTRALKGAFRQALRELLNSGLRKALLVSVGLAVFQQFVGINTIIYYAPTIFQAAGAASATASILATSLVGIVNVLATLLALVLVDRFGRRPLLLWGTTIMMLALLALGIAFATITNRAGLFVLLALFVYIIAFATSFGPIFWLMSAELFPTRVRAAGSSISSFANWGANFLVSATFLTLVGWLRIAGTFWLYAAICVAALLFIWFLVPETKGKSLEEIEQYWQ